MNIGLTGGIASGKSTVSQMLVRHGALLVDADQIAREIVLPGSPALQKIADQFGADMLLSDGSLHRKRLGEIVFANPEQRKLLESITHPAIRARMMAQMSQYEQEHPDKLVVVDVPLLFESGMESLFQMVMVVYVPRDVQLQRLMNRDCSNEEQARQRLAAQMDIELKRERADVVIDNSHSLEETERQVLHFLTEQGCLGL
ncbi:dephospho-CoA kinase [Paenibacillus sp. 481]|uniref:dephospho-CoA kinase n=1 Tax=Paenibacillus sp. 481 TaxID=2835869 RepID=UPI001E460BFC|nr:dephospho-CoA kinase [Paenibacillus sp. 481]UHA72454.1 dephospho-CoA kinase [Paenibacillus sp. 481]